VHTLEAVEQLLSQTSEDLSAAEVAERTGMSRATAQRYLSHLHELGRVEIRLRYGSGGRPEHGYRWRATGLRHAEISRMTAARIT
jgi:two-component system CitB family response regulator